MQVNRKIIKWTVIVILILSWPLFPFLSFDRQSHLHLVSLYLLAVQLIMTILTRKLKMLWLLLLNPVIFLAIVFTLRSTVNYVKGTPAKIKCSYHQSGRTYDPAQAVYIDYWDDDCDFSGIYSYTMDINNFVTDKLINIFGNPIRPGTK